MVFGVTAFASVIGTAIPAGAAPASSIYVANGGSTPGAVSVINGATNAVTNVPVGTGHNIPVDVALSNNGRFAYVTTYNDNSLKVIDTRTNAVVATVGGLDGPEGVTIDHSGKVAYVIDSGEQQDLNYTNVTVISLKTDTVLTTIQNVGHFVQYAAITSDDRTLYLADDAGNDVTIVDTRTNTVTGRISAGASFGAAVDPVTRMLYVTHSGSNTVSVIDTRTNTVTATIPVGTSPMGVAVGDHGGTAYVANYGTNTVSVISTATNTVTATVPVGPNPYAVAVSRNGRAYVTDNNAADGDGSVSVISTATNTVTATVPVGSSPYGVAAP
jgi:YVTN family beta-propeller protein